MRLCFVIPASRNDAVYTPNFLMNWTDLIMRCAQRGHQVMVSQQETRPNCFTMSSEEVFDAYLCIDPDVVFTPDDVFKLLESPHDVTGAMMMSSDASMLTCGKKLEELLHMGEYPEVDALEPSFVLIRQIPEGWNYTDPIKAHIDTSLRVGHRVTLNI
jgi:hypothetical protein